MEQAAPTVQEVYQAYLELVREERATLAILALIGLVYGLLWQRGKALGVDRYPWFATALTVLVAGFAVAVGLKGALDQASLVDDAFISFRYAHHWVEGHGLVWNVGERVEGYTNFLWVVLLAAVMKLTPWEAPEVALAGCLLCFVANLVVVTLAGRRLAGDSPLRPYLPLATVVLSVHWAFTSYATTGMEAMLASLLVNLGVLALLGKGGARGAALAGTAWIAATFTRPDHAIFYVCGGIAVLADAVVAYRRAQRAGAAAPRALLWTWTRPLLAYAAPFGAYVIYALWKLQYYGSIIPNTFHAKSADETYWSQGLVYAASFLLGSHFWLPVALLLAWLLLRNRDDGARRFRIFAALSIVLFSAYVARVGGDFMYGRFFITLVPLALLGAEGLIHSLARQGPDAPARWLPAGARTAGVAALVGLMLATAPGVHLIKEGRIRWYIADEGSVYRLTRLFPAEVDHPEYRMGQFLGRVFTDRGIEPTLSASAIGMLGYYSRLPLIDARGLTDAAIGKRKIHARDRPGHEKFVTSDYLIEREVDLIRGKRNAPYREEAKVRFEQRTSHPWVIVTYRPALWRRVRDEVPEARFLDLEAHLDEYIATLDGREWVRVRQDLRWFDHYYFDHVDDPARRRALQDWLATHDPRP